MSNVYANFIYDFIIDLSYYINQDFAAVFFKLTVMYLYDGQLDRHELMNKKHNDLVGC